MAAPDAMITAPAIAASIANRAPGDPLSSLISEGISVANSILTELSPPHTTSSPSTSHTSMTSHSTTTSQSKHSRPTQSTRSTSTQTSSVSGQAASSSAPTSSQSSDSGNNHIVIILSVVLSVLAVLFAALLIWLCLRRRKRKNKSHDTDGLTSPSDQEIAGQEYTPSEPDQPLMTHNIPAPSSTLLESHNRRTLTSLGTDTSSNENPFLTPPLAPDNAPDDNNMRVSRHSSDMDSMPITPVTPLTPGQPAHRSMPVSPVELDGVHIPGVPRKSSRRSRVHYPSAAEMALFDFGWKVNKVEETKKRPASYSIPRRPVGGRA